MAARAYTIDGMNRIGKALAAFGLAVAIAGLPSCMTPVNSSATKGTLGDSQLRSSSSMSSNAAGLKSSYGAPSSAGTVLGGTIDAPQSQALSDYLKHHQLPLVGGQVVNSTSGGRQVILFGFVASDYGKTDAEQKARNYLKDPTVLVDNRIKVSPELAGGSGGAQASGGRSGSAQSPAADAGDAYGGAGSIQDYENSTQMDPYAYQAQQYQQYGAYGNSSSGLGTALQFLGLIGALSAGSGGFHGSYGGFSSGYAPSYGSYGYPSYPPYPTGSGFGPP